ncbi:hypothetical protein HU200_000798 [Digitaria exilis]|uniref:Beta-glucosidase n=1 Tax=Digitaria exilis TaxID=1010633 RepID=A0A835FZ23_9POAL|nr:hypothetical protein HU200_000798 [Digitaria exilis]
MGKALGSAAAAVLVVVLLGAVAPAVPAEVVTRADFPPGFVFGVGSSAYQVEGAVAEDGRKPSIWDTFTHDGYSIDSATGDVTADQYHKYKEDVKLLHEMGVDAYRMSIAWPRLIPDGRGAVNPKGLEYYNNLIDELLSKAYADVCFKNFGDRVRHWSTVNEPNIEPIGGFDQGILPPRRCSFPFGFACDEGNSTTEPYIVAHHLLLAHASAVSLYREKYQAEQGGRIGLTLLGWWYEPATENPDDIAAAARMNDFHIGWFMHPMVYGDYPPVMRKNVGSRLPSFSDEDRKRVTGSFDFVGFNHYIAVYVKADLSRLDQKLRDYMDNVLFYSYVTFNLGISGAAGQPDPSGTNTYDDEFRSQFLQDYIEATLHSIRNGSNVQGYFVWSFLDVFEYLFGYRLRFGVYGVDFNSTARTRYQRHSAKWYSSFLRGGELRPVALPEGAYSE